MVRKSSDIFKLFSTATSIFTLREAAKFLHVCPNTLRNWDNSGELKASLRFGKRGDRRYLKNDLVQYIEKNKVAMISYGGLSRKRFNLFSLVSPVCALFFAIVTYIHKACERSGSSPRIAAKRISR